MKRMTDDQVLALIEDNIALDGIVADSNWKAGEIVAHARECGWALNVSSKRFQRVAPPKPKPAGIVRISEVTSTVDVPARPAQRDLIAEGKSSSVARVQRLAVKAENALADLAQALNDTREQEAARAEIARLEEQLRDAKARLKGEPAAAVRRKGAKPAIGVDYRALDEWCQANGKSWRKTGHGRPTNALIEEYRAALGAS